MKKLLGLLILLLTVLLCIFAIQSNDLFLYLAVGKYFSTHGAFPATDPFIYSLPNEPFYWSHHWLGAQLFYWIYENFSLDGEIFFKAGLVLLLPLMALGLMNARKNFKTMHFFFISLALFVSSYRFIERTSLFTDILCTLVLLICLLDFGKKRPKWMWLLPFVFALWINLHPGFLVGIFIVALFWIFEDKPFAEKIKSSKLIILALSCAALFCNPKGLSGILYPILFSLKQGVVYKKYYTEWLPSYSAPYLNTKEVLAFFLLSFLVLCTFIKNRILDARAILFLFFLALGLSAVRFLTISSFGLLLLVLDIENHDYTIFIDDKWYKSKVSEIIFAATLIICCLYIVFFGYVTPAGPRKLSLGIDSKFFPVGLVKSYESMHVTGNIFNSHEFGDYLAWYWNGNPLIYFHGGVLNTDFYENDYLTAARSREDFDRLAQKYNWTILFVDRYESADRFMEIIAQEPDWRMGGEDDSGILYYKVPPAPQQ